MQTDELEGLLPTEADVVFYEEHGHRVTGKVLPDNVVEAAQRGAERHWSGERDWVLPVDGGFADWTPDDGDGIRNSEYTALQNRDIRALVEHPVIGAIAARLTPLAVHMQDETNGYRRYLNEQGVLWQLTNDNLGSRGSDEVPDYADPTVSPVLWPIADLEQ